MELFHLTIHALFVVFFVRRVEYVNFILEVKRIKKRLLRQHQEHMLHASVCFSVTNILRQQESFSSQVFLLNVSVIF